MAKITFLGGDETDNPAKLPWGRFTFIYGQAVECDDPHIIAKASINRFFQVGESHIGSPVATADVSGTLDVPTIEKWVAPVIVYDAVPDDPDPPPAAPAKRRGRPPKPVTDAVAA